MRSPTQLRQVLEELLVPAIHRVRVPLELLAHHIRGEPVAYGEAVRGDFRPFHVGEYWGQPWSTTWFHVRGAIPAEWPEGADVVALFDLGYVGNTGFTCEALAWRDGRPWRGVDPNHRSLPIVEPRFDFYLEAAANPLPTLSGRLSADSMLALRESPNPIFSLNQAELAIEDRGVRKVALDFKVLLELAGALPEGDRRGVEILAALDRFAAALDPQRVAGTAALAAEHLEAVLARPSTSEHLISAIGHAHLDTAWLWPLRETRRKCARSFSNQLALMDAYPEYRFACSQPAQYEWMRESYPEIFEGIRQRIATGQWEPVGSMWVEADCNLPSGEALVRQLLHGKRYFMREFGYETRDLWLPDVFGYPGSLPQLIKESGCDYFLTQKLSWNEYNKPAHHTFMWEGIDGTAVFTHFPPADTYNGNFTATEVVESARRFKDAERSSRSLYLFGWGDGGGGPEPDMIEAAHRLSNLEGAPRVELERADDFFAKATEEAHGLTTWRGELYFELHRGTYTSQAETKMLNRRAEQALRAAEVWSVAAGGEYPAAELEAAWKLLLLNQFHDILPGSSIDWVYADARRDLAEVIRTANDLGQRAISSLGGDGGSLTAFNATGHHRREVVEVEPNVYAVLESPPCGWAVAELGSGMRPDQLVRATERSLENDLLRVEWGGDGLLTSIWDKEAEREVLAAGSRGNLLQLHDDNPTRWDAWDIDIDYRKSWTDLTPISDIRVESPGGLRGAVRFTRMFGASRITQRMVLDAGSRVLRFECDVDWQEEHKLLKVAFPVAVRSSHATYEIQFGHLQRPTHSNTSWDLAQFEVCAQRWADLGEAGYGVALLNDCKYGYDIQGSVMRLTLLRAPTHPDPTADRGRHRFTYALMPHAGDFRQAGVIEAADDLNAPLRLAATGLPPGSSHSLIEVDRPQVVVEAIKRAEDSTAVVVRLYEAWGGRCRVRVRVNMPARRAWLCDLLERERTEVGVLDGELVLELTPFKILTLKLEP